MMSQSMSLLTCFTLMSLLLILAVKETEKKKKKKKKKDSSRWSSQDIETIKTSSPNMQVSECNRDTSTLMRPLKSCDGDRKPGEKHLASHKHDVRVKEEMDRRQVNCSNSRQRHGTDVDVSHDNRRFLAVDGSRSACYVEKSSHLELNQEDRSSRVKTEGRSLESRHHNKSSSKNRVGEISGQGYQRDTQEKRHRRSTSSSPGEHDDHRCSRVIEPKRTHQHRSPQKQKRHKSSC